jgi:septum formation protein
MSGAEDAGASRQASSRPAISPSGRASRLVLASGSPQRRAILGDLGLDFEVRPSDAPEEDEGAPRVVASENAMRKALAVADAVAGSDAVVIGCDTLVATELEIWGKPPNEAAARETLRRLSGRTHEVVSGLAVVQDGDVRAATEVTEVTFRDLDDEMVDWYLATGEWDGRAGGYAIQGRGAALVKRIDGDYLNVVGLPVTALLDLCPHLMRDFGTVGRSAG